VQAISMAAPANVNIESSVLFQSGTDQEGFHYFEHDNKTSHFNIFFFEAEVENEIDDEDQVDHDDVNDDLAEINPHECLLTLCTEAGFCSHPNIVANQKLFVLHESFLI
jgi:hypothetical protein